MANAIIQTIEEMEKLYYSQLGQQFLQPDDMMSPFITKDAAVTSGLTGVYNAVYGAQAWVQLNMEANTFGMLPKVPWTRSGWRVITARTTTLGSAGQSEDATLPATVKPTFAEVSTKPKLIAQNFENTEVHEFLATEGGDDAYAAMADLRAYMAVEHKEEMNVELNVQNGTTASNNLESIDRVAGSYEEKTNAKENDESTGYSTDDMDIYSINRDADGWSDAYVSYNSTSGSVRSLTDSILQAVLNNTLKNGANPDGQIIQTGYDTWSTINQLYDPQVRYNLIGAATIQPGVNGIKTIEGVGVGTKVATLFGKPIIVSKNTVVDTGGISRFYMLDISNPEGYDLPRLCIRIAKPTQYFEAGISQGTPFAIDKFGTEGMYRTMGELIVTFPAAMGKARDLNT